MDGTGMIPKNVRLPIAALLTTVLVGLAPGLTCPARGTHVSVK